MMDYLKNFDESCEEKIKAKLVPFEVMRQKMLKKHKILNVLAWVLISCNFVMLLIMNLIPNLFSGFIDFLMEYDLFSQLIIVMFIIPTIGFVILSHINGHKKRFSKVLRENIFPIALSLFKNIEHSKEKKIIPDEEIIAAGFFESKYMGRSTDDGFVGQYKGFEFKISEDVLSTGGKHPTIDRFVNISFENLKSINSFSSQDEIFDEAVKSKKTRIKLAIIFGIIAAMSIFLSLFFANEYITSILMLISMPIAMAVLIASRYTYSKFENKKQDILAKPENEKLKNEIIKMMLQAELGYNPQLAIVKNKIMLNLSLRKNEDLFELKDINTPLENANICKKMVKQITFAYEFIDFIETKIKKTN